MRCSLCPGKNTCVASSGPRNYGGVLFVGEAPGWEENKKGIPFIGKTGREVDFHYLPLANLRREECDFTNSIKCLPDRSDGKLDINNKKDIELLLACSETHLYNEIEALAPSLLVPMGAFACYAIDPSIDLNLQHGMPVETVLGIPAFPMWHPAGGIHEPKKMLQIRTDWIRLKRYLNGSLYIPQDEYPRPDYREVRSIDEILSLDILLDMACDTETSRSLGPYCITYSVKPGTARLIKADRKDLLQAFQRKLDLWVGDIWFHNWPYDAGPTREMGLRFKKVRDTMLLACHLGNLPQGLKALAFRELGMAMQSFEDTVKPYSTQKVLEYYREAYNVDWPKPEEEMVRGDDGRWKIYKAQGMNTKLKRFFTDYMKNPNKDVFASWDNWIEEHWMIEEEIGPWPGMDIAHVPFLKAKDYACRDADATLRLAPVLQAMVQNVPTMKPQELWRTWVA